jgi:hypothetical protein
MIVWKKSDGIHHGHEDGEPNVAVLKNGPRWDVYTHVALGNSGKHVGRFLTWRPTLKSAKARAEWAYLADMARPARITVRTG